MVGKLEMLFILSAAGWVQHMEGARLFIPKLSSARILISFIESSST